ncbi:EamA family transporter RarD [Cohnella faecalis]|uniref:EamA family transporter RarD n=1 Tax=Cohnella faecalis TaxID=2315694 RepID=A0A398CHS5_9BACL|nr:EamA family transporter RarD [Cohnella faecalis]RIE00679.1 EamA family transporter RarD [Cohnella faecalis]
MKQGLIYAILAYTAWGLLPLYWKWFEEVPAGEILSHRVVWSFVLMAVVLLIQRKWKAFREILADGRKMLTLGISGILISANWLIFIWAVNNGHVIETSLGYYLNPLMNVVMAVLFLREKPNRWQWAAVALAGLGVLTVAIDYGRIPWISLSLALSFSLYGLVKKKASFDASIGLLGETAFVFPIALVYLIGLQANGQEAAWSLPPEMLALLLLSGLATAMPLIWFAKAAARLPFSMLGFIQYIGPSISLLLSVWVFREPFSPVLLASFSLIWAALVVFMAASARGSGKMAAKPANS